MEAKITSNSLIQRSKELVSTEVDGETVMMSIENGKYYGMNKIGSRIWKLIENPIKVEELCDKLIEEYEVRQDDCKKEALEFLNTLNEGNLVTVK